MEVLVITDGKLNDPEPFEKWLSQADESDDERDLGDLNSSNLARKMKQAATGLCR